jgi:methyltransferase-like protein/SAM-dependent methyltransferase
MTTPNTYDEVPYHSFPFAESHPARAATVARLFGLNPPDPRTARVLELGCCTGGNLFPMAELYPEAHFLGIDLSERQIEIGKQALAVLEFPNIELRHASILDVEPSWGQFDYIICHGVYSWVPEQVQNKILSICKENLSPTGIAYISYNTLPGWHMRGMIRDMMQYHAKRFAEPQLRIKQSRLLLDFLRQAVGDNPNNAYASLLKMETDLLKQTEDWYLFHEHLEEHNNPLYFYQFVERAQAHGLKFLGESMIRQMVPGNYPPEVEQVLQRLANDIVHMEQYMDFIRNRMFRMSLLCHPDMLPDYGLDPQRLRGLYVASGLKPENAEPDLTTTANEKFVLPNGAGSVQVQDPLAKNALMLMADAWPRSLKFDDLCREARKRISPLLSNDGPTYNRDVTVLGRMCLQFLMSAVDRLIEIRPHSLPISKDGGEKPKASAVARYQATHGKSPTNLKHEVGNLGEFERNLLLRLDGTRTRAEVLEVMYSLLEQGLLNINVDGQIVRDPAQIRQLLEPALNEALTKFGLFGYLLAEEPAK